MNKKLWAVIILIAFFIGGIGGVTMGRFLIPYLASVTGIQALNKLVTTSPIVITRTQQVQLNEGVNLIDLVKQAGNVTAAILDANNNFLGNGVVASSDGLILTTTAIAQKSTSLQVIINSGQKFPATIKAKDAKTNLAIVNIQTNGLSAAQFEPATSLQPAQRVIYVGRSNTSFEHEVLAGFVTQSLANQLSLTKQIYSDAQLSPDYFGGPIINLSGHVVGLTLDAGQNVIAESLQALLTSYLNPK